MATAISLSLALTLIALRVPIGAAFLIASAVAIFAIHPEQSDLLPLLTFRTFDSFILIAVPLFLLAADLLVRSGMADIALISMMRMTRGRRRLLPPGVVGLAMFFAGITGSSVAEAAALGKVVYPTMRRQGFSARDIAGLAAVSGSLGILIPPSLTMVIYGALTQTSVAKLFLAGVIPGLVSGVVLGTIALLTIRPRETLEEVEHDADLDALEARFGSASSASGVSIARLVIRGICVLAAPVIVFGGIYGGLGTPTEVAGLLVVYAAIITLFWRDYRQVFNAASTSAVETGALFLILAGVSTFAFIATQDRVPQSITERVLDLGLNQWVFLVMLNLALLVLGSMLDGLSMLLLTVPLFFPPAMALGIDPYHLAVVITVNIEIACITPPVGVNLFAIATVTGLSFRETSLAVLRWYPISLALLALFTFVPWFSTGPWNF